MGTLARQQGPRQPAGRRRRRARGAGAGTMGAMFPLRAPVVLAALTFVVGCPTDAPPDDPDDPHGEPLSLTLPRHGIGPAELGVIVNTDDPLSAPIAEAYLAARGIPEANRLDLPLGSQPNLDRDSFVAVQEALDAAFGPEIQALALTSMQPQTVDCMGAAAAFGLGFHTSWCQPGPPCNPTARADGYDSDTTEPFTDHGIRPTMILAAETLADAEALIARGVAADGTRPIGARGFLVRTSDSARSSRWEHLEAAATDWGDLFDLTWIDNSDGAGTDLVEAESDLLFYWTGLTFVDGLETNTYLAGAVADHLTSFGGQIPASSQMSALAWLQGGATASYGTAIEPCNYPAKFPNPEVLIPHYLLGDTVVEAYWKSVWMPGEGNFVGEPLAQPFGGARTTYADGVWTIATTILRPEQRYALEVETADGWEHVQRIEFEDVGLHTITVEEPVRAAYRLIED